MAISGHLSPWLDEAVQIAQEEEIAKGAAAKDESVSSLSGKEKLTRLTGMSGIPMPLEVSTSVLWMGGLRRSGLELRYVLATALVVYLNMMWVALTEI